MKTNPLPAALVFFGLLAIAIWGLGTCGCDRELETNLLLSAQIRLIPGPVEPVEDFGRVCNMFTGHCVPRTDWDRWGDRTCPSKQNPTHPRPCP